MYQTETADERTNRFRAGTVVAILCVAWWLLTAGGIILMTMSGN